MNSDYWKGCWKRHETGWHQPEAEPRMTEYFSNLKPTRVFVPLCGKSLDLVWLRDQGHEVVGVELVEQACREFFSEHHLSVQTKQDGPFTVYEGDRITIYNGDFFDLESRHLNKPGAVYDRAALIALPSDIRARYAERMIELIKTSRSEIFHFQQIVVERTPADEKGPPFSISSSDIKTLYGDVFEITLLSRELIPEMRTPAVQTHEFVYDLKIR